MAKESMKARERKREAMVAKYAAKREALKAVLLIVDSRRGLSDLDKVFIAFF